MTIPFDLESQYVEWVWCENQWGLKNLMAPKQNPIRVDFLSPEMNHRRKQGMGRQQVLSKAIGLHKSKPSVIDVTGGFGVDSFVMASLGAKVTCIEKNKALGFLLNEAVERASQVLELAWLKERLNVVRADSLKAIADLKVHDVIYMDPMFPESKKTALSSKEMQLMQLLSPPDEAQDQALFGVARAHAGERVVVKRPLHAPALFEPTNHVYLGKTVRYDMYLTGGPRIGAG